MQAPALKLPATSPKTLPAPRAPGTSWRRYEWASLAPFLLCHVMPLAAVFTGVSARAIGLCAALYVVRMFGVTGGYHRYFSHRTYKTSRAFQFAMAFLAETSVQRGALWWAAHHRNHHKHSDQPADVHSPLQHGFWHSHMLWIYDGNEDTDFERVRDLARFPELVWLDKHFLVPPAVLGVLCFLSAGWSGLFVGFFLSTVLLWHGTFTINSLSHVIGTRRFETPDGSRNHWLLALITLGEGWHNNHHHYQSTVRQGFRWWEIDITYYLLRALAAVGVVWDLREIPDHVQQELSRSTQ